jgi:Sulfotransferase domain
LDGLPKYALLTYQKAGSQWVKDVVFGKETLRAVPGALLCGPSDHRYRLEWWSGQPSLTCSGPFYNVSYEEWTAWSRPSDRALHVYRDPRDRLISWVFSMSYSHPTTPIVEALRAPLCSLDLRDRISLAIVITGQAGIWMTRSWLNPPEPRNFYSVSFERLIEEPAREYGAIFAYFGWDVSSELIDDVLAAQSFEARSGGRVRGETNELSHYRRGIAGDWRTYFDRNLGKLFEENYPRALVDLGYESDVDWFETLPEAIDTRALDESAFIARDDLLHAEIERLRGRNEALEAGFAAQVGLLQEYQRIAGAAARHS